MTGTEHDWPAEAAAFGFTAAAELAAARLQCTGRVRSFCSPTGCANFGTSWICPPGCGSLEDCQRTVDGYQKALLLQSLTENVDTSDKNVLWDMAREHNRRAWALAEKMRQTHPAAFLLTTGGCELCETCTFPLSPCRRPDKQRGSLSAFGIDVGELCRAAGLDYAFVPGSLRLIACILYS